MSFDPLGRLVTELRDDAGIIALGAEVCGGEPAPRLVKGPGHYLRFVVLARIGSTYLRRAPMQGARIVARCYGTTHADAGVVAGAVFDALHGRGLRITPAGYAITGTYIDTGDGVTTDPDTEQPHEDLVITVGALTTQLGGA